MNKIKNRLRGLFNKYTILLLFTYFVFGVGFSYAYFAYSYQNTTTIVGNVIAINATLEVEQVVGTNEKMVPMQNLALSNALKGVNGDGVNGCIDANGNLSCQVYKITLNNTGSRLQHITGTIELYAKDGNGNVYNNLRWQELTSPTAVKTDSNINSMSKSALVMDLTMETGETREWYIAVWISEIDADQRNLDKGQFGGTVTFETTEGTISNLPNTPNLDNGNLLPVYYDDTVQASDGTYGVWKKADSTNEGNSWYDYSNKMWANAVIVDPSKLSTYQTATIGTTITDSDIIAFYVWIPRYKYKVWNLNRQGTEETGTGANVYSYPAFTNGIDIEFEHFEGNTGNVECIYDTATQESEANLSDNCYYKGSTTPIKTTDSNPNDAWYTHPAFTFGGEEIEGFWIGKFETSTENSSTCYTTPNATNCDNTNQNPKILPDVSFLRYQTVSNQFTTSRKFQTYLSSDINAHMLTNLEWGAVAYLTHSIYGLCGDKDNNGTVTCEGVNQNNSSGYFTGRSGGAIAGSAALNLDNVYGSGGTTKYNTNGYYNYKGYKLTSDGNIDTTVERDITKVASTTKNVTGVYDMSGGAHEYVMGNMVNSSNQFYPSSAVSSGVTEPWNGSSALDSKFYNSYSYGTNYAGKIVSNRGRLGDATVEVLGGTSVTSAWKPGSGVTGSSSVFANSSGSWFNRGGYYNYTYSGAFYFYLGTGAGNNSNSFRSSLS